MTHRTILPEGWKRPRGYANGMAGRGELLAIAGQIACDENERIVSSDFVAQFQRALANVLAVVQAAGGAPQHIVSLTIYVVDKREYLDSAGRIGDVWRSLLGKHYPAMALVEVSSLLEDDARVEIQGLALIPGDPA